MTPAELLGYLTDETFNTVAAFVCAALGALIVIHGIGGRQ